MIILISYIILKIILTFIKRYLLRKVKSKKQASNVTVFLDLLKYLFAFFFIIIVVFSYYNSWGELSFIAGLLTIALGWALQKPITGVVGWLVIITRKPFRIGDRVIIMNTLGIVSDISLTHIMLDEVGGTIDGEEESGRTVMIPTSIIFEEQLINYTERDEYILDEVKVSITYESNLAEAEDILKSSVKKIMFGFWDKFPKRIEKSPHTRILFKDSGVEVIVRYHTIAYQRNRISTDIRREIHKAITQSKNVEFAYPHTEVLFREK